MEKRIQVGLINQSVKHIVCKPNGAQKPTVEPVQWYRVLLVLRKGSVKRLYVCCSAGCTADILHICGHIHHRPLHVSHQHQRTHQRRFVTNALLFVLVNPFSLKQTLFAFVLVKYKHDEFVLFKPFTVCALK